MDPNPTIAYKISVFYLSNISNSIAMHLAIFSK